MLLSSSVEGKTPAVKNETNGGLFSKIVIGGTYRLVCGDYFYIGSSYDLNQRRGSHALQLKRGRHTYSKLQEAFNKLVSPRDARFEIINHMPGATTVELREAEQRLLDEFHGGEFCCNLSSTSVGATCPRPDMAARWKDPVFREKMQKAVEGNRQYIRTPETSAKMSDAHKGAKNPNARATILVFKGEEIRFGSAIEAARHIGVTSVTLSRWLSGKTPWPGSVDGYSYAPTDHLIGLTGYYDDDTI